MKYQLLVLDIDGTTANSKKEVDEETRNALIWLQSSGIKVVLASGRPPEGVFPVASYLELHCFGSYVLAFNGAKIIELVSRRCLFNK